MTVDFYFDPACPWTWYTATWLDTVATELGLQVCGHPMSLWEINHHDVPSAYRGPVLLSLRSLRLTQSLDDADDYQTLWRYYRELGSRVHDEGQKWSNELIEEAARAAGVQDLTPLEDESLDETIAAVTAAAMERGGQDIGSPLLVLPGVEKGFHGPVVSKEPMPANRAISLWESVVTITDIPEFLELKHGRG